jgi:dTDP-4-dehydrorhamnose reductase
LKQKAGIYHVATTGLTTPYEIRKFMAVVSNEDESKIKSNSLEEMMTQSRNSGDRFTPRPLYGGLDTTLTQRILGIEFHSWQDAVKEALQLPRQ